MLLCDFKSASMREACNRPTHVFCAGLTRVPRGEWIGPCCTPLILDAKEKRVKAYMEEHYLKYIRGTTMENAIVAVLEKQRRQDAAALHAKLAKNAEERKKKAEAATDNADKTVEAVQAGGKQLQTEGKQPQTEGKQLESSEPSVDNNRKRKLRALKQDYMEGLMDEATYRAVVQKLYD